MKYKLEIKRSKVSGLGLFTNEAIPWGMKVIQYKGEVITDKEADRRGKMYDRIGVTYLFELGDNKNIDGLVGGDESRFINHSEDKANLWVLRDKDRIWFCAKWDIEAGEELLFDYGFQP